VLALDGGGGYDGVVEPFGGEWYDGVVALDGGDG
jgi:type IV secretory pathway VirB4 component